ncbi:hypothetical protein BDFB_010320, partial [Asbolus verrucosus]
PLDFFLWEYIKEQTYRQPVHTLVELVNRINGAIETITTEMISSSLESLVRRAHICLQVNGGHFEHLL